jgi:hypothetical protein
MLGLDCGFIWYSKCNSLKYARRKLRLEQFFLFVWSLAHRLRGRDSKPPSFPVGVSHACYHCSLWWWHDTCEEGPCTVTAGKHSRVNGTRHIKAGRCLSVYLPFVLLAHVSSRFGYHNLVFYMCMKMQRKLVDLLAKQLLWWRLQCVTLQSEYWDEESELIWWTGLSVPTP